MNLRNRIEKLEEASRPPIEPEPLRVIRMVVSPGDGITAAICGDRQIERNDSEREADFQIRAAKAFNRAFNGPCVQSVDGDEDI